MGLKTVVVSLIVLLAGIQVSSTQRTSTRYIFFLHNRFIEEHDLAELHPEYGRAEYVEILSRLRSTGFTVLSEKRARNTDVKAYAKMMVRQVDSLIAAGVPPQNITIVGTSKGGYIAQYVSTYARNPKLNFVLIGCYMDSDLKELPDIQFCGNVLSIYEKTDSFGVSCLDRKRTSKLPIPHFKEIELHTNCKHGFLYHPMNEWILPTIQWAMGNYSLAKPARSRSSVKKSVKSASAPTQ